MTEHEKLLALVRYRLDQADEALRSAEVNHAQEMERSAVNRAYYAMFYAVLALLASRMQETSKHSGAIALFDRLYVKPGLLSKDFSRWLHDAFNQRQSADYAPEFSLSALEVRGLLQHAREFLSGVTAHLRSEGLL